jgi:hypothetical protein
MMLVEAPRAETDGDAIEARQLLELAPSETSPSATRRQCCAGDPVEGPFWIWHGNEASVGACGMRSSKQFDR